MNATTAQSSPEPTPARAIRGATTVVGDLAAIASGRLGLALLSAVSVLITTRMLGPVGYGTVAFVGIVGSLIFTVSSTWTGISVRRYGREYLELTGNMSRLTWNRAIIAAPLVALSIATVIVLKVVSGLPSALTWPLVGLAVVSGLATIVVDHWVCLLETGGRMRLSSASQVSTQLLYVICLAVLFVAGVHGSPQLVITLSLATSSLFIIGIATVLWRVAFVPVAADRQLLRRMLALSLPMIGFTVSQYVFASIDLVVLHIYHGQADVGIYAVAYQAYTVLSRIAVTATAVFVPLFVSLEMAGRSNLIDRYFSRSIPQGLFAIALVGGLIVPLLPILVPVVFGHPFAGAATPLAILAVGLAFLFAGYLISPILTLHEQTRAIAVINAIAAVINVAGDFLLLGVFHMGIEAPAIATSSALVFMFVAFYISGRRTLGLDCRPHVWTSAPLFAALLPTLLLGGAAGALAGIVAAIAASAVIVAWRSPFTSDDAELIAKLDLPDNLRRVSLKALRFLT